MKSIYDMMGRHTYPILREDAPLEHVERFFQVCEPWPSGEGGTLVNLLPLLSLQPRLVRRCNQPPTLADGQSPLRSE